MPAYHVIWHTYGSWLPGHEVGWKDRRSSEIQPGNAGLLQYARDAMIEEPVVMSTEQRRLIAKTIRDHCKFRQWELLAINVLPTHVHAVIVAAETGPIVISQLKAWCSRRLNEKYGRREHWWSGKGYDRRIDDEAYLNNVIHYVVEEQDERPLDAEPL
jgi:REP element-mobilizing transposase RayT